MEPILQNAGALQLPWRSIFVIAVQAPTEQNTQCIYQLNTSDDLPSGLICLAVNQRIHHKYPTLLNIPLLNREFDTIHNTVIGTLHPIDSKDIEFSNISDQRKS